MLTRYQSHRELYNRVLDEPNMLGCILQHLNPKDIVRLSLCGKSNLTRFHDTIKTVLIKKQEDLIDEKVHRFCREVSMYVEQLASEPDNRRTLDDMFEFLLENKWYKEDPSLRLFDITVETKLVELAFDERYSHSALNYLSLLFDIQLKYIVIDGILVEYIEDSEGKTHFI
jgi:hypothetical protein